MVYLGVCSRQGWSYYGGRDRGWLTVLGFLDGFLSLALVFLFFFSLIFLSLFFFFTPPTIGWLKTHLYPPKKSSVSLSHYSLFCYFLNQTPTSLGSICTLSFLPPFSLSWHSFSILDPLVSCIPLTYMRSWNLFLGGMIVAISFLGII